MTTTRARENPAKLAPKWHTALLVLLIVCVAVAGTLLSASRVATPVVPGDATAGPSLFGSNRVLAAYLPAMFVNASLLVYVSWVGRPTNVLLSLLGELPRSARAVMRDLSLAFSGLMVIEVCEVFADRFRQVALTTSAELGLLPANAKEKLAWIAFAVTAGFCEEVVYRGYLQTQLRAFSRSAVAGVGLQAVLFGLAHLDQGAFTATRFAIYGAGFGALALWRRSLIPGILCHVTLDLLSGLIAPT